MCTTNLFFPLPTDHLTSQPTLEDEDVDGRFQATNGDSKLVTISPALNQRPCGVFDLSRGNDLAALSVGCCERDGQRASIMLEFMVSWYTISVL